ncbi:MAG: serine protease, partial [Ignavibacteriaceae bacterium]
MLCPTGNGWQNERNSVALIIANGHASTGALMRNTCNTNTPYFLTANHVYDDAGGNVSSWVFQFQYWSATCTPNSGWHEDIQFTGSILRARNAESDFALLQLNQTPATNSGIQYAGWNRSGNAANTATCIHHPRGDLMKISSTNSPVSPVSWMGGATLSHWQAIFNQGIVQPGSSGAPLFDQNHRIVGQLHGNQNNACSSTDNNCYCNTIVPPYQVINGAIGEFGRFDLSWTGGGTNATRLSNWLDPNNSGATTTTTTNISALYAASPTLTVSGAPTNDYICSGSSTYTLSGLPANASNTWSVSGTAVASIPNPSTGATVVVTKTGVGVVTLTANVILCGGQTMVVNKTIMVGPSVAGYYRIYSNYHNAGIFYPLYNNNSPIWLPANQTCEVDVYLTSPALQSATWTRSTSSYPFNWNTSGTFLSFAG